MNKSRRRDDDNVNNDDNDDKNRSIFNKICFGSQHTEHLCAYLSDFFSKWEKKKSKMRGSVWIPSPFFLFGFVWFGLLPLSKFRFKLSNERVCASMSLLINKNQSFHANFN